MPAAIAVPAITGALGIGASLFGAHKQAGAAKDANRAQEAANAEAIALQREQMANEQKQWDAKQQLLDPYRRMHLSLFKKYGIGGPSLGGATPRGPGPMPKPMGAPMASPADGPIMRDPRAQAAMGMRSLADLRDWSNWQA